MNSYTGNTRLTHPEKNFMGNSKIYIIARYNLISGIISHSPNKNALKGKIGGVDTPFLV